MSRRFVVGIVAAILAVMVLGGIAVWTAAGGGSPRTAALEESTSSGSRGFNWYLFGGTGGQTFWADLESVAGCDAQGEVATVKDPTTGDSEKHVAGVPPSVCRLQVTVNSRANGALYAWINDALSETYTRKDLTLLKEVGSNQFLSISLEDALIERIELPAFEGVSTAPPASVGLTLRPEASTRNSTPSVASPTSQKPAPATTNAFRVDLTGLGLLRPSRFEPWSAEVKITPAAAGASQPNVYQATETSLGDLGLSIPRETREGFSNASQLQSLHDWFNSAVIQQASSSAAAERTLTLTARDPATGATLLTVTFTNVGIFAQPSYWIGNDPEKFLFYAEGVSFAGVPSTP